MRDVQTLIMPELALEEGRILREVPVAYNSWGVLDPSGTNAIIVCHALTGNAEADNWWSGLIGPGKALDTDRYFVIAGNVLGSPYGSVSPLSINPKTNRPYGSDFPIITTRDTVRAHRWLLEQLGVRQLAMAIGGSMGGMHVLEWAFEGEFVRTIVPIAVGGRHSSWCIGWSEVQRQAIYADPAWNGGNYLPGKGPQAGLSIARMAAMISYRSQASFETRFGRNRMPGADETSQPFAIESYLRYQGKKLVERFDALCYVRLTQQMDSHDVARGRGEYPDVLRTIKQPALVLGIPSDVLYVIEEQEELARYLPHAQFEMIDSPEGHDGFLIAFDEIARHLTAFMQRHQLSQPTSSVEIDS